MVQPFLNILEIISFDDELFRKEFKKTLKWIPRREYNDVKIWMLEKKYSDKFPDLIGLVK